VLAGLLVAGAGTVELYGWLSHTRSLVQLRPGQVPMQFDTALLLTLLGTALALLPGRRYRMAAWPAAVVAAWGAATTFEYVTGRSFGIDQLLFHSWLVTGVDAPGRMARNTAACFAVLGMAVLVLALSRRPGRAAPLAGVAASFVAALGFVALFGYASGVSTAYTWRTSTAMAPLTAGCLLVVAIGCVVAAWGVSGTSPRWLPVPVGVGALATTLFVWQALVSLGGGEGRTLSVDRAAGAVLAIGLVFSALLAAATGLGQAVSRRRRTAETLTGRLEEEAAQRAAVQDVLVRRAQRDEILRSAYSAVALASDLEVGFEAFALAASRAVSFQRVSLTVVDDEAATVVAASGEASSFAPVGTVTPLTDPLLGELVATRRPYLMRDVVEAYGSSESARLGFRSFVVAPVVIRGATRALLSFASLRVNAFTDEDLSLLDDLTTLVGGGLYTLARLDQERETTTRLRELDELKNEFVGIVAHDLRSPMAVITGYVDTVLQRWDVLDDAQKQELLGVASRHTKRLAAFVGDVLQVSRMESGDVPYDIRPFDLGALVERTAAEMATPDRPVVATVAPGVPRALADEDRQWRVLTNLISNAQKFSPHGTPVVVSLRAEDGTLAVAVADRGPGIPAEDVPRLFGKFSRLAPAPDGEKGTGLGLYICKSLVEAQGGTIDVTSTVGEGTTFRYTVPVA
jgi:signal transduction histidine kinase